MGVFDEFDNGDVVLVDDDMFKDGYIVVGSVKEKIKSGAGRFGRGAKKAFTKTKKASERECHHRRNYKAVDGVRAVCAEFNEDFKAIEDYDDPERKDIKKEAKKACKAATLDNLGDSIKEGEKVKICKWRP